MRSVFGWSYPPGVTGNEPQIVGYDEEYEADECRGCGRLYAYCECDEGTLYIDEDDDTCWDMLEDRC